MPAAGLTLRRELSRKAIHLGSAVLPIAWSAGVLNVESLRLLLTVALAFAILVEGARHLSAPFARRFEAWFGPMLRPHEWAGLTGATWLAASMLGALVLFPPVPALIALWAAAVGDASASIVGRGVSHVRGTSGGSKTIVGSLACVIVTALGVVWFTDARLMVAFAIGILAALAEWPRGPLDDNVRVTAVAGLAAWGLGVA